MHWLILIIAMSAVSVFFNPKLNDKPVVVLSNNDGCVVSRSEEAKLLGIKMGIPWFQIEKDALQAGVQVYSSNYTLYAEMSRRFLLFSVSFSLQMI